MIRLDAEQGTLEVLVGDEDFAAREPARGAPATQHGTGRELFAAFRRSVGRADQGASVFAPQQRTGAPSDLPV